MSRVIIHIRGGTFDGAVADSPEIEIMVVDHDNIEAGDPTPSKFEPVQVSLHEFATTLNEEAPP